VEEKLKEGAKTHLLKFIAVRLTKTHGNGITFSKAHDKG
jgi:hypothetical protein